MLVNAGPAKEWSRVCLRFHVAPTKQTVVHTSPTSHLRSNVYSGAHSASRVSGGCLQKSRTHKQWMLGDDPDDAHFANVEVLIYWGKAGKSAGC
jgi:hypothetical protein